MVEVPDSTTRYIQSDSGKPTKDLFNWMRDISRQISAIFSGTGGGLFSSGLPCFSVHKDGTNQTGVSSATYTQITWSTEVYDVGSHFASNLWTPPAGRIALCGAFIMDGTIAVNATVATAIFKNGSLFRQALAGSIGNDGLGSVAMEDAANGTDTYGLYAFCSLTAGTGTLRGAANSTWFMGHWISP